MTNKMTDFMGNQGLICPHCGAKNPLSAYPLCHKCGKSIAITKTREATEK